MQFWSDMLKLICPPSVEGDWHGVIKTIVQERIASLTSKVTCIDVFCDHGDSMPDLLTSIFMTEVASALDKLLEQVLGTST